MGQDGKVKRPLKGKLFVFAKRPFPL